GGADVVAGGGEAGDQRTAAEAGGASHQNAGHAARLGLPRANRESSAATVARPSASAPICTHAAGSITVTSARAASSTLTTRTRVTMSRIEKPRSVARW